MPLRTIYVPCLLGLALTGLAAPAYAYLDPGTGSMILQILLGGAAGVAFAGRLYWRRFLEMIGARPETATASAPENQAPEQPKPRARR